MRRSEPTEPTSVRPVPAAGFRAAFAGQRFPAPLGLTSFRRDRPPRPPVPNHCCGPGWSRNPTVILRTVSPPRDTPRSAGQRSVAPDFQRKARHHRGRDQQHSRVVAALGRTLAERVYTFIRLHLVLAACSETPAIHAASTTESMVT